VAARRIILLDFDGTACRGDEPARAYAEHIAATLPRVDGHRLMSMLDGFLDGTDRDGTLAAAQDGYQAVATLAAHLDVPPETTRAAFLSMRQRLADGEVRVEVPDGLIDLLTELRRDAMTVLATNSPAAGMPEIVGRLGLDGVLDEIVSDAAKPTGLPPLLDRLLDAVDARHEPHRLLSIGDIWANDLRIPRERGCATAYIDRFDRRQGPADARASVIEDLYGHVRTWAS
jgi:FMN phosphatase YigB (HAD superfamily)